MSRRGLLVGALLLATSVAGCGTLAGADGRDHYPAVELAAVPFFPQEDFQCGPAALATVLAASGDATTPQALAPQSYLPQRRDRICPFIAPWYPRFEAILQNSTVLTRQSPLFPAIAAHLLQRDPAVLALFDGNPFPGRPPAMVRMSVYRLWFADWEEHRRTGEFWHKEYKGDYAPLMLVNGRGEIMEAE